MSSLKDRETRPSGTRLAIPPAELRRLHEHAVEGYPHEVVGILAGDRAAAQVRRVEPLVNERADSPANRYRVGGLLLMKAEQRLQDEGMDVLGYYHSHPDHPATYSDEDRDQALPNLSYVIAAVHGPVRGVDPPAVVDTAAWRLREDRSEMDREHLDVSPPPHRTPDRQEA
jgi:proteasome lid subunit RPN8/RPN11